MDLKKVRQQLMKDSEVAAAQRQLQPKLDLGRQILDLRLARGWTQKELAARAGTKQANISRLENGLLNPSVDMLQRVAEALGAELTVTLEQSPQSTPLAQSISLADGAIH
jgi:transcriptional regulator with XRE-family HTH domain